MAEADGSTSVEVVTDLAITGKPAQFGRGVMQDVSDKLLGPVRRLPAPPARRGPGGSRRPGARCRRTRAPRPRPDTEPSAGWSLTSRPRNRPIEGSNVRGPPRRPPTAPRPAPAQDDSIDLGATVLPVLARTCWKQGVGLVAVLALLVVVVRRRRD